MAARKGSFAIKDHTAHSESEHRDDRKQEDEKGMVFTEARRVCFLRSIVVFCILGFGALVSWGTFYSFEKQLTNETEDKFFIFARALEDVSILRVGDTLRALQALSNTITAQALSRGLSFPFVTMENWEVHAREARNQGFIEALEFLPWLKIDSEIEEFNNYAKQNIGWQQESIRLNKILNPGMANAEFSTSNSTFIFTAPDITQPWIREPVTSSGNNPVLPVWTQSPPSRDGFPETLYNSYPTWNTSINAVISSREFVMGTIILESLVYEEEVHAHNTTADKHHAHGEAFYPVFTSLDPEQAEIGGFLVGLFGLDTYMSNIIPNGVRGIHVEIGNSCCRSFTYRLDGAKVTPLGQGDWSDSEYSHLKYEFSTDKAFFAEEVLTSRPEGHYTLSFTITATSLYMDDSKSNLPLIFGISVALIFLITAVTFFIYDMYVQKRNKKVATTAARSTAIVESVFPSQVRDRLLAGDDVAPGMLLQPTKTHLKNYLTNATTMHRENSDNDLMLSTKPIADLFTETTIMFADICGFTAWSSVREPSQVFTLLETVYRAFDYIARKRGVFKVETVGDCYVAVCGLPDPCKDHAVVMGRFARDCIHRMGELTQKLEVMLGPDTGELSLRVGLHSGPVTAGVLRGERSRFQLFGDTMNTASRMESTGEPDQIQISEETAMLLLRAGKEHWFSPRERPVTAKGKGTLTTFWLKKSVNYGQHGFMEDGGGSFSQDMSYTPKILSNKTGRLIDWTVEKLFSLLKEIVHRRQILGVLPSGNRVEYEAQLAQSIFRKGPTLLDEVEEVIWLPRFNSNAKSRQVDSDQQSNAEIPDVILDELTRYVTEIASMYKENPFHNFEHASHVTMSVVKLLSRIVAPSEVDYGDKSEKMDGPVSLHDHTYGITSDPLTQFSCVLSALIHDVDHPGVPNAQLVQEQHELAVHYKGKSVAEQNSVDLAWDLLMDDRFENLRAAIYVSEIELRRFRQLVVNSVMATDIVDKELKALRNARWETAFSKNANMEMARVSKKEQEENLNRKATIVIEHLIQASDVAHTMQHWHVYRKWNDRFFVECYQAYLEGRAEKDPAEYWYQGEIGFFDFYIIPLAKKLKDCGVFGVSSEEYYSYAKKNRDQWEHFGQGVIALMVESAKASLRKNEEKTGSLGKMEKRTSTGSTKDGRTRLKGGSQRTIDESTLQYSTSSSSEEAANENKNGPSGSFAAMADTNKLTTIRASADGNTPDHDVGEHKVDHDDGEHKTTEIFMDES
ncbi:hypothetical protein ACA910_003819 [Epithemia clementina (nom. ined.)]